MIEYLRDDGLEKGINYLEITNNIINKILIDKIFLYENCQTALLIGYTFLKIHQAHLNSFSSGKITDLSTLDDIRSLTASWLIN